MTTSNVQEPSATPTADGSAVADGARQLYKVSSPDDLRLLIRQAQQALVLSGEPLATPAVWIAQADAYDQTNMVLGVFASPDSAKAACNEAHSADGQRPPVGWSQAKDGDWYAMYITPDGFAIRYSAQSWEVR